MQLKSYALGDEDTIQAYCVFLTNDHENKSADAFVEIFGQNGTTASINREKVLQFAQKFVIGLWLGTTSITFALILHVGRCSIKVANAMNKVLWDITEAVNKIISIPQNFLKLLKSATSPIEEKKGDLKETENKTQNDTSQEKETEPQVTEQPEVGMELTSIAPPKETQLEGIQVETDFGYLAKTKTATEVKNAPYATKERQEELVDHAFAYFSKGLRKFSSSSVILVLAFLFYDIYVYLRFGRKLSYDWFMLFPFPFWFLLVFVTNVISFTITEIVLYCKSLQTKGTTKKQKQTDSNHCKECCSKAFTFAINCITTISATTLPVFIFFHLFWLSIASSLFAIRIASSALFYIPVITFLFWFLSITTWILQVWKKLIKEEIKKRTNLSTCKRICHAIPRFIKPLIPYCFLPFWCLLLATLHFFSGFLLTVVDIKDHNILVLFGIIVAVIGITKKLANHCKPNIGDDEDHDTQEHTAERKDKVQ